MINIIDFWFTNSHIGLESRNKTEPFIDSVNCACDMSCYYMYVHCKHVHIPVCKQSVRALFWENCMCRMTEKMNDYNV